jgi:hypothetical protein
LLVLENSGLQHDRLDKTPRRRAAPMQEALDCKLRITLPAAQTKHASEFAKKIVEQRHLADDPRSNKTIFSLRALHPWNFTTIFFIRGTW